MVPLGEVAEIEREAASSEDCATLPYIGLEHIESSSGRLTRGFDAKPEVMSATKFKFTQQHVLYGKLRPYLDKRLLPDFDGVCSTEILPILPCKNLDRRFLFAALSTAHFVSWASTNVSGANLPRLSPSLLEEYLLPLPPLEIQRRIANVLERADRMRRLRQHALEMSDTYLQSVFLEMFGSAETNSKNWDIVQLEELCEKVVDCPHSTPKYLDEISPYPCIRSSDLQNGYLDFSTTKYVSKDEYTKRIGRTTPVSGDILYCREGARYGNGARVPKNIKACLGQRVMLFRVDQTRATSAFFWALILSPTVRRFADNAVSGSASPHINVQDIREFSVFCPPLELQEKFARIVQTHEHLRAQQLEAHRQAQHLYDTLLHQAFTGQLDTHPEPRALQASLF
jgi:type I restriction enzyme, S subunit